MATISHARPQRRARLPLFYGDGFGLVDTIKPAAALLLSLAIWGVQIPISVWWFRHFRFGPMEWLWRRVTYGNGARQSRSIA